jgi:hypothetical protein
MKYICIIIATFIASTFLYSCKQMTPGDFLKIEDEVIKTDLQPQSKEKVAAKYGYSLRQYEQFEERAKTDKKLQEDLGKIRLERAKAEGTIKELPGKSGPDQKKAK